MSESRKRTFASFLLKRRKSRRGGIAMSCGKNSRGIRCGGNSGLHIIIFDEIDAICKQRGSMVKIGGAVREKVRK